MIYYNGQVLPLFPWPAVHFSSPILLNLKPNDCRVKWPCIRLCWTAARRHTGRGRYSYQTHASLVGMVYIQVHARRHLPNAVPWISEDRLLEQVFLLFCFQQGTSPEYWSLFPNIQTFAHYGRPRWYLVLRPNRLSSISTSPAKVWYAAGYGASLP